MKTTTATAIKQNYPRSNPTAKDNSSKTPKEKTMKTTTATAIKHQSLSPYYFTSSLTESSLEVLNDMEIDLESIMAKEFAQGLPSDLDAGDV